MKRVLLLLAVLAIGMIASAQIGSYKDIAIDTSMGNENDTSEVITVSGDYSVITFDALCTQLGGTSDGTILGQGSLDGSKWFPLIENSVDIVAYPNDTLTITNGAVWSLSVLNAKYKYYRFITDGTASDTTLVQIGRMLK